MFDKSIANYLDNMQRAAGQAIRILDANSLGHDLYCRVIHVPVKFQLCIFETMQMHVYAFLN